MLQNVYNDLVKLPRDYHSASRVNEVISDTG